MPFADAYIEAYGCQDLMTEKNGSLGVKILYSTPCRLKNTYCRLGSDLNFVFNRNVEITDSLFVMSGASVPEYIYTVELKEREKRDSISRNYKHQNYARHFSNCATTSQQKSFFDSPRRSSPLSSASTTSRNITPTSDPNCVAWQTRCLFHFC